MCSKCWDKVRILIMKYKIYFWLNVQESLSATLIVYFELPNMLCTYSSKFLLETNSRNEVQSLSPTNNTLSYYTTFQDDVNCYVHTTQQCQHLHYH